MPPASSASGTGSTSGTGGADRGPGGPQPSAGFDPDAVTGWTLVRTYQLVARRFHATFARADLTPTHFGVLMALAREPGTSQAALARSVFMTPQAMGELLSTLEARGLVTRSGGARGTPTPVVLTRAGQDALQRAVPLVADTNHPSALGLSEEEDATLNALLHKVRRALGEPVEER